MPRLLSRDPPAWLGGCPVGWLAACRAAAAAPVLAPSLSL